MRKSISFLSFIPLLASCGIETPVESSYPPTYNKTESLDYIYTPKYGLDTVRILAIGNSYAQDALYDYFHDICRELNTAALIGVLHSTNASLAMHLHNIETDSAAYYFRVQKFDGSAYSYMNCNISKAIIHTSWDIVTLQQMSAESGIYESYVQFLQQLMDWIRLNTKDNVKIGWHQTWAYDEEHVPSTYNFDQNYMYNCIMNASSQAMHDYDFDFIVPCGTAIQNARNSILGDNLNRDGYHLDLGIGRYIAACTWAECVTGKSVINIKVTPKNTSEESMHSAQIAAHNAVASPFEVSDIKYVYEINQKYP